ncbi:hypothetical protein L1F30_08770 [Simiduia sp. 21SJ11W-1]|uniref:hypothetical protein n=1 Tax=Simiduia sp. 21SJ11W-1 TaxID=2909669 RepID=UPI00209CC19F|nr:hypothetical protein [Simiduia sp. 21SJ11W-1]UTA46276.1 hypothetical protein L1F30_08770 [Simiduia sp. 21SJ11W-1]
MNTVTATFRLPSIYLAYQAFKYCIYCLLLVNLVLFFQENTAALAHTFKGGVPLANLIEAYSDTIDTAAWVLLLLLFELETYVLNDKWLTRRVTTALFLVRGISYLFISYSLYGYLSRYFSVLNASPFSIADACTLVGTSFTQISTLNEYIPITLDDCAALNAAPLVQLDGTQIIGTQTDYGIIKNLAFIDVVNAATWLLIVVILEIDVYLQTRHAKAGLLIKLTNAIKVLCYVALLGCAIYWGMDGDFLDFWDAFLWLIAFVFIEMNLFEWQKEIDANRSKAAA